MEFLAKLLGAKWKAPRVDGGNRVRGKIGEHCNAKDLKECRALFGERLEKICATCPE